MSIPGSGSPLLLATTAAAADAGYVIPKSLRFSRDDTSALVKTPSSAGNRRTFTWSAWVKRSRLGIRQHLFNAGSNAASTDHTYIDFWEDDTLHMQSYSSNSNIWRIKTTQVFRDCSSFYHIVWVFDTTESTASNRNKLYINGSQVTDLSVTTYPSLNYEGGVNAVAPHAIGKYAQDFGPDHFDGYMADVQFVDGLALAPTDFGETRSSDGVWVPKEFTGFGTNPNNGTTWSSTYSGAFAGNAMTDSALVGSYCGLNSSITITLAESVTVSSSLKLNLYASVANFTTYTTISINGTDQTSNMSLVYSTGTNSGVWEVTGFTGTLSSIGLGAQNGANNGLARVIVDNNTLLNGAVDNSFHLNFSDSSTNEALGFDSAPTIPDADPKKGMDVITYTGNGGTQNIGGLNFEPGLVWIKNRDSDRNHYLYDSIRGAGTDADLSPSTTDAENSLDTGIYGYLSGFNPDGFTVVNGSNSTGNFNSSSQDYVAWTWRAGGPAVSNSDGTTTSQVSANTDYGFSIVTYTGGTSDATIGHGLGQTPKFYIVKARESTAYTDFWSVYHTSLGESAYIKLNQTSAATTGSTIWNSTAPTTALFSVDATSIANENNTDYVAYVWSEVSGYSKFGTYEGTGSSTGPVITTGFKPRLVIIKNADGTGNWRLYDTERDTTNPNTEIIYANSSIAESTTAHPIDMLDDGFQIKGTHVDINTSGETYVYAAWADRPGNNWDVNNLVTNEGLSTSKTQFDVVTYTGNGGTQKIGGEVYSSGWSGSINSTHGAAASFDGNDSTYTRSEISATATWTAATSIPFTTLKLRGAVDSGNGTIEVNGVDVTSQFTANSSTLNTQTITGVTSPLTSIKLIGNASSQPRIAFVEIDGTVLLDGTGPGLKFQPDLIWIKSRSSAQKHVLVDSVRTTSTGEYLASDSTQAEGTGVHISGTSDGFRIDEPNASTIWYNDSSHTYVAWCWKAGGTAVSNTDGSITSSVSANAQYGFSVVSYTGTGSDATVGHGLNTTPKFIITKNRDRTSNWDCYHVSTGETKYLELNSSGTGGTSVWMQNTAPTSSVFSVKGGYNVNQSGEDGIAYCFADVPGYQRIGSYTGNGSSTGPVVVTGFKPRFLIIKRTDAGPSNWYLLDTERDSTNPVNALLRPNLSDAEVSAVPVDMLQNGFQPKDTDAGSNASGGTYVYLAIGDDEIGSDEDCLVDVPNAVTADADATDTTGGYQRGNYATLNPLDSYSGLTLSNGNLTVDHSSGGTIPIVRSTIGMSSGKWYFEVTRGTGTYGTMGIVTQDADLSIYAGRSNNAAGGYEIYTENDKKFEGGVGGYDGYNTEGWDSDGDVASCYFDADNGKVGFMVNGVDLGFAFTGIDTTKTYFFHCGSQGTELHANFGQMRFKYPIPSGYAALNTTALPAATIADGSAQFDTKLYTGNGSSQSISSYDFNPDLVWLKGRSVAYSHQLYDSVRGVQEALVSDTTAAESTRSGGLTAFNSDGFTIGNDGGINNNTSTFVGWAWNAGSSTVSNTDGSITSSVRANASAGFSIVTYTGSSSGSTVGHGLNAAPEFIIGKRRDGASEWSCYHKSLGNNQAIILNTTAAGGGSSTWNSTTPSSSVVTLGSAYSVNYPSYTHVLYCFAPVAGYSAIGSYEGNSTNTFVYTGFRSRFILIKNADDSQQWSSWSIYDTARDTFNACDATLYANQNQAEGYRGSGQALPSDLRIDILSNGFVVKSNAIEINLSGDTYIYYAVAENPFQANGGLAR